MVRGVAATLPLSSSRTHGSCDASANAALSTYRVRGVENGALPAAQIRARRVAAVCGSASAPLLDELVGSAAISPSSSYFHHPHLTDNASRPSSGFTSAENLAGIHQLISPRSFPVASRQLATPLPHLDAQLLVSVRLHPLRRRHLRRRDQLVAASFVRELFQRGVSPRWILVLACARLDVRARRGTAAWERLLPESPPPQPSPLPLPPRPCHHLHPWHHR